MLREDGSLCAPYLFPRERQSLDPCRSWQASGHIKHDEECCILFVMLQADPFLGRCLQEVSAMSIEELEAELARRKSRQDTP